MSAYSISCGLTWWTVFLAEVSAGHPWRGFATATLAMLLSLSLAPLWSGWDESPDARARR
jgi:hypothetical protein